MSGRRLPNRAYDATRSSQQKTLSDKHERVRLTYAEGQGANDPVFLILSDLLLPTFSDLGYAIQLFIDNVLSALLQFLGFL